MRLMKGRLNFFNYCTMTEIELFIIRKRVGRINKLMRIKLSYIRKLILIKFYQRRI